MSENNQLDNRQSETASTHLIFQKIIPFVSVIFIVLNLIFLFFIYARISDLSGKIASLDKNNTELTANFENSINRHIQSMLDKLSESTQNELKERYSKYLEGMNFEQKLDEYLTSVRNASDSVIDLAKSKIIQNEQMAKNASEMAQKALENNDPETARIYLLNAVNHAPYEPEYLIILSDLAQKHYAANPEVISQIKSVAELALFQLPPDKISQHMNMMQELDKLYAASISTGSEEIVDWKEEFTILKQQDMNQLGSDPEALPDRIEKLNQILSNLQEDEISGDIRKELEYSTNLYTISLTIQKVENYLQLLESEKDYGSHTASARLLSVSSAMSVFWEHDISRLPPSFSDKIEDQLPQRIGKIEENINRAKSEPHYNSAMEVLSDAISYNSGNYQSKIQYITGAVEKAMGFAPSIQDHEFAKKFKDEMSRVHNRLTELKKYQYIDYQKWAAGLCADAFRQWKTETMFSDEDAKRIFRQCDLAKIDLSLVSPEVNNVYQQVIQKFAGELKSEESFNNIQMPLMLAEKKKYEDF